MDRWLLGIGVVALAIWALIRRKRRRDAWWAEWHAYQRQPYD